MCFIVELFFYFDMLPLWWYGNSCPGYQRFFLYHSAECFGPAEGQSTPAKQA